MKKIIDSKWTGIVLQQVGDLMMVYGISAEKWRLSLQKL